MRIDSVEALEDLGDTGAEGLGEGYANARGEDGLVVDRGLDPGHQMLDIGWCGHFGRLAVLGGFVLPEVLIPSVTLVSTLIIVMDR